MENSGIYEAERCLLVQLLPILAKDLKILDLGTGTGFIPLFLSDYLNAKILAIDFSEKMINIAKHKNGDHKDILFLVHDINKGLPLDFFDTIICSFILGYLDLERTLLDISNKCNKFIVIGRDAKNEPRTCGMIRKSWKKLDLGYIEMLLSKHNFDIYLEFSEGDFFAKVYRKADNSVPADDLLLVNFS